MPEPAAPGVTPEQIVAYLDGELPAGEREAVERAIAADPVAARMAAEMRGAAEAAAAAFAEVARRPVPARLSHLLEGDNVVPLRARPRQPAWRRYLGPAVAASIGLALLAAIQLMPSGPSTLRPASDDAAAPPDPFAPALYGALDTAKPGETVDYGAPGAARGGRITILGELATRSGLICREFHAELRGGSPAAEDGIACRRPDGGWDVLTEPRT
ncbi:MAG: hypothetical protein U1E53_05515 [Dongiaceae bacterium]